MAALGPRLRAKALAAWHDPWVAVLAAVLAVGLLLRVYLTVRFRPALVNYSDTGIYIQDAYSGGFADPLRVVGYGIFLIPLHWITPHMLFVVLLQHAIGLATAVLFYVAVRRCGAPQLVALVPAIGIALGGTQIFLEHAILTEALFTALVALALYASIRTARGELWWALVVGLCIGMTVTIRGVGTVLLVVFPLWLLLAAGRPSRSSALRAGVALGLALAIVGGYVAWRHAETGLSGLTTNSNWNLYGRVAPFADCTRFTPPDGTEGLCDPVPPSKRHGRNSEYYIYDQRSPAQKAFGPPFLVSRDPDANKKLGKFSFAAIKAQPGNYLNDVWIDLTRIVAPNRSSHGDLSYDQFIKFLIDGPEQNGTNEFVESWRRLYYPRDTYHRGDIDFLKGYERATRLQGPLMVLALLLAAIAVWVVPRSARSGTALFGVTALALLVYPIATHAFDARFVIPALGPLLAAAALGAWGLALRLPKGKFPTLRRRDNASPSGGAFPRLQ